MFKDKYKEAHNEIVPDKELLQKILATADYELRNKKESAKLTKNTKHTKKSFYPYLYAAAAVMVITTSLTAYNALKSEDTLNQASVLQKEEKNEIKLAEKNETTEEKAQEKTKESVEEVNTYNKAQKNVTDETKKLSKDETVQNEVFAPETEALSDSITVLWNVNTVQDFQNDAAIQSRSAPLVASGSAAKEVNQSIYEDMTKEEYEGYLGFSPEEIADIPVNMALYPTDSFVIEKDSQTGEILNDENTYYYEETYERFIMITTTKKTNKIDSFLNNETYKKSVINNNNVVITLNEGTYNAYLKRNDTGIKITAGKIEEKELENTIKSLLE